MQSPMSRGGEKEMDSGSFLVGLLCGGVAVAFAAFILNQMRAQQRLMGGRDQSLDSFPDARQSNMTPGEIVRSSRSATLGYFAWLLALIVIMILSCGGLALLLRV
jgi:hypothetical protein